MLISFKTATAFLAAASSIVGVSAIAKITRTGRYLYDDSGKRFFIKGIAYQQQGVIVESDDNKFLEPSSFSDPLADANGCNRDIKFLQDLSVNAIRVYSVDSTLNHDACMQLLSNAGIYTIIDLSLPLNGSLDRQQPSWSTNLLDQYLRTIDTFSKYDNVLAYNVGNEVINSSVSSTADAPYIKAAARDVKAYLKSKNLNSLVGYAAIDASGSMRVPIANFLSCDPDGKNQDTTAIDLYGLNNYEWCGDSSFSSSGYSSSFNDFAGYNVVAYFSEYGCIKRPPRLWTEVASLFSTDMSPVWSGGIAFSYFPAKSGDGEFGMVTISTDGSSVTTSADYDKLKDQYGKVSFPTSPSQSSSPASTYGACPTTNSTFIGSTSLPPTPNEQACNCLISALSCRFTPATSDYRTVVGELIDFSCDQLGQKGKNSCDEIGGSGENGTYGRLSGCDPTIKLSYLMSQFYELNNRDAQACSFNGNGTVNSGAPTSSASDSASSCISDPSATFLPAAPSGTGQSTTLKPPSGSVISATAFFGVLGTTFIVVLSTFWTLA